MICGCSLHDTHWIITLIYCNSSQAVSKYEIDLQTSQCINHMFAINYAADIWVIVKLTVTLTCDVTRHGYTSKKFILLYVLDHMHLCLYRPYSRVSTFCQPSSNSNLQFLNITQIKNPHETNACFLILCQIRYFGFNCDKKFMNLWSFNEFCDWLLFSCREEPRYKSCMRLLLLAYMYTQIMSGYTLKVLL